MLTAEIITSILIFLGSVMMLLSVRSTRRVLALVSDTGYTRSQCCSICPFLVFREDFREHARRSHVQRPRG